VASKSPVQHAWRVLLGLLLVTATMFGINSLGVYVFKESSWAPELALDLQGGTQIVLSAVTPDGADPTAEQLNQAVKIIRQRVDASGVAEAEITTEGGRRIVVQTPGTASAEQRARIEASAQMELRAVIMRNGENTGEFIGSGDGLPTLYPTPDPTMNSTPTPAPTSGSDLAWVTEHLLAEFNAYSCFDPLNEPSNSDPTKPMITCDTDGWKYLLGPTELDGSMIDDAVAARDQRNGQWAVNLTFNDEGREKFGVVSQRLYVELGPLASPRNQFAFVLDGWIISAPAMQAVILTGNPSISGSFDQASAQLLADQLRYGALPLSFTVESSNAISATLGSQQLQIGLIAGLIGLILVALYSLLSYRALGAVIIASLVVMAVLTYIIIAILAWRIGFRLSLAGVAGIIVSIGFVADSFIVYFERIRDELRDGKGIITAVEDGWARAKRTIYISKSINVLAAVVLYILADSTVKGFAFTLGLTTVLDVFIFVIFTHPVMQILARTKFFGQGHPLSGMDPKALGAVYHTRTEYRTVRTGSEGKAAKLGGSRREAAKRQTIAERKRAEALVMSSDNASRKEGDA
jgi:preprotein translocase subunit SecD